MLKNLALGFAAMAALVAAPAATAQGDAKPSTGKVGEKIPAFAGKVVRAGKEADFDSAKNAKVTAYVLVGQSCPATKPYVERLIALEKAYEAKGVEFVYVYPNVTEKDDVKAKFHADNKLGGTYLNDKGAAFVKLLKAQKTGEALLCDKEGKVLYRGGIDDNIAEPAKVKVKFIAQALDEILAGKPVSVTTGPIFG